jgi:transmembrane sensor
MKMKKWGKNSDSKNQFQEQANALWRFLDSVPQPSEDLERRILSDSIQTSGVVRGTRTSFSWIYRAAAAIFVLIGAGIWYYYSSTDDVIYLTDSTYESVLYQTTPGERIEIHLTEHIYIQLNTATELRVLSDENKSTPGLVYLSGEAYFNVTRALDGFTVLTDAGIVQLVGTSFNVRARGDEIEVAVESGMIALRGLPEEDIDTVVQVPAGHKSTKYKNTPALEPLPIDIEKYLSWRKGRFVFVQTPLSDVVRNLERAYNVRIDIRGQTVEDIRVTGEFGQEPLMQILNEICWSANLRYRQEEDIYILYQPD